MDEFIKKTFVHCFSNKSIHCKVKTTLTFNDFLINYELRIPRVFIKYWTIASSFHSIHFSLTSLISFNCSNCSKITIECAIHAIQLKKCNLLTLEPNNHVYTTLIFFVYIFNFLSQILFSCSNVMSLVSCNKLLGSIITAFMDILFVCFEMENCDLLPYQLHIWIFS